MEIKPGDLLQMKSKCEKCDCTICNRWNGEVVTFKRWVSEGRFFIEEGDNSLYFENVEKVLNRLPDELFEIE